MLRNFFGGTSSGDSAENGANATSTTSTKASSVSSGKGRKGAGLGADAAAERESRNKGGFFGLDPTGITPCEIAFLDYAFPGPFCI